MANKGQQSEESKQFINYLTNSDFSLIDSIPKWRSEFINLGGFDHLIHIFQGYKKKNYKEYRYYNKLILGFILQIL